MDIIILFSFPKCWNGLVMVVGKSIFGLNTLKLDDVASVIPIKEMQIKSLGETLGNALTMESRGRQMKRGRRSSNHSKSRRDRSKSRMEKIVLELW